MVKRNEMGVCGGGVALGGEENDIRYRISDIRRRLGVVLEILVDGAGELLCPRKTRALGEAELRNGSV